MTVIDASVFVDSLVSVGPAGERARAEIGLLDALEVPAIFRAEVVSAFRGLLLRHELHARDASLSLEALRKTKMVEYPFEPFIARAWELRDSLTVYDAWYVALAERLATDLVTADERLASARGPRCAIRLTRA